MPNIDDINTAVYGALKDYGSLAAASRIYKGQKRPSTMQNPSVTVSAGSLEPGEGEGIWTCDIAIAIYADVLANRMPDHETHREITEHIRAVLRDRVIELDNAKALPLTEGASTGPGWDAAHDGETVQEAVYGLVFVRFM